MLEQFFVQLPALQVAVPLIAAAVCVILRHDHVSWGFATVTAWFSFVVACLLLNQVLDSGPVSYSLGNWPPPWGIEYKVDAVNAFVLLLVSGIASIVLSYARRLVIFEIEERNRCLFYAAFLLCLCGLLGVVITGDAFNVFVFLEISSLSTYVLVAMGARRDRRALSAAINYLIAGTIGATFFVIGVGLLYMAAGTLNMDDLAQRIDGLGDSRLVRASFAFIVVGIGIKLALFPLHLWLPNAYTYAPSVVTSFLAATSTKVAVYLMFRFIFTVYGVRFAFQDLTLDVLLLPLAILGMFVPSIVAVFQVNIKRMFAYSSVAQIGYMLLGASFATVAGVTAGTIHLVNHALMKGTLFMALGAVVLRVGSTKIDAMAGLGRRMPWTMAAFIGAGLSLIGVPLTVGFISKWLLIEAALEAGHVWAAGLIVIASLITVIYVWRVVEVAYFRETTNETVDEAPFSLLAPIWILLIANIYFGINAQMTTNIAERAATALLGGAS